MLPLRRSLLSKSVIFFDNTNYARLSNLARDDGVRPFRIFAGGRPIRLGGRAFDGLMALIAASPAVVSKDELSSRVRQGRIVDSSPRPACGERVGLRGSRKLHKSLNWETHRCPSPEIRADAGIPTSPARRGEEADRGQFFHSLLPGGAASVLAVVVCNMIQ